LHIGTYQSFTHCYLSLVRNVYENPTYESAPRGQKVKEILGASFTILNPRDRIPYISGRKFSITYMVAELIWYLSANNKTEWISKYSAFWKDISDDGVTANSAYGARLFRRHPKIAQGRLDQWAYIIEELKRDPDSRRAVMHLRVPDDSVDAKLDVPCTLALQFFIREGRLHQIVNMRSSDVIFGIAYDIPAFTIFQELLANELGVELGTYTHMSNSLHIYERHFDMAENILKTSNVNRSMFELYKWNGPMPPIMCSSTEQRDFFIEKLMSFEDDLHKCESSSAVESNFRRVFAYASQDMFTWHDWGVVLATNRMRKLGDKESAQIMLEKLKFSGYRFNTRRSK
jgi:thymidylate synthase